MTEALFFDVARRILPLPTAPYHEHFVIEEVRRFVAERPGLRCVRDAAGNLAVDLPGDEPPSLILTAHLDHPGLGFGRRENGRDLLFQRLGGVPVDLARNASVRVYAPTTAPGTCAALAKGRVTAYLEDGIPGAADDHAALRVRLSGATATADIPEGAFAMWDLPPFRVDGRRLVGRACDDLAGVCVALAVLDHLHAGEVQGTGVLLTRAEETGFGGMLAAVASEDLDRGAVYVNIECSSWRAGAPLGEGPVIRVGDRRWIFDAGVTGALTATAERLARSDEGFRFQRRLMDAGTCEATPLSRSGYATGAVALPLDNYHNHGGRKLRPEAVHLDDAVGLVQLLIGLAGAEGGAQGAVDAALSDLDQSLTQRRQAQTPALQATAAEVG